MSHKNEVQRSSRLFPLGFSILAVTGALSLITPAPADAATLCVNHDGKDGCYSSISAAVGAANPGDTVKVAPGTYAEDVTIGESIALVGSGWNATTIDATNRPNGVYHYCPNVTRTKSAGWRLVTDSDRLR